MKDIHRYIEVAPRKLSKDREVVHNRVVPQSPLGMNGFRAWAQPLTGDLELCECGWGEVEDLRGHVHYRVKGVPPCSLPAIKKAHAAHLRIVRKYPTHFTSH
jgi:hypothetical protein